MSLKGFGSTVYIAFNYYFLIGSFVQLKCYVLLTKFQTVETFSAYFKKSFGAKGKG